ncbi:MAG: ribonuclease H-like domain-containing protein [Xanthomonadaceae bacterium]|nr:ribonuclease H-like domain-containing protein [Xanthomonadaceae bacterium]
MSALHTRLRQLRSQAGHPPAPVPVRPGGATALPGPTGSPLSDDLRRLLQRHAELKRAPVRLDASDREVPGIELSPGLRYTECRIDWLQPRAIVDATFARMPPVDHRRLLHFDTETTGLAGGTGTRAFMIGAADWIDGQFRIRQLTITSIAAETAMLRRFAEWIGDDSVLVSYNGKCYDAPLLATRYRLARLPNPLAGLAHIDLLHPVRRHWKGQWENCRLATAERRLLGVVREDDLPGAEAPAAWLTYLRGGSARNLRRVAAHNAQDLKSLAGVLLSLAGMA